MDEAENQKQPDQGIEFFAMQMARSQANIAKWGLNIAVFLFAILIIIIVLVSMGIQTNIVALVAILGLCTVWLMGWRRGRQLYQRFYTEELTALQQKPSVAAADLLAQLTPREIQILNHMAQGYANKQIALELNISTNTVKVVVSRILDKLSAKDRTEAVVIAIKQGLVSIR